MSRKLELAGVAFGRLVVLREAGRDKSSRVLWLCLCECGKEIVAFSSNLVRGNTESCGCDKKHDLLGNVFGWLTVVSEIAKVGGRRFTFWKCLCECGVEVVASYRGLVTGRFKSCGCLRKSHGYAGSRTYRSWTAMRRRCSNLKNKYYGGRGISVCFRWQHSFTNFLADMGERPIGCEIDRLNPDGNYELDNCCWALKGTGSKRPYHRSLEAKLKISRSVKAAHARRKESVL